MNTQDNHPSQQTLVDFARGKLEAESLEMVSRHIENCATCIEFLERSSHDTFVEHLKDAVSADQSRISAEDSGSFDVNQTQHFQHELSAPNSIEEVFADHPKYKLISQIGSGGMGAVYKAQHRLMDRIVAIKVIRPELVSNSEAIARFHNEVRAAAMLSHRNIVAAYDAEQVGDSHLLIMEFVVGESLSQTIARKGRLSVTHACNYALQVAQGLKHAHEQGMIHRDIKPHNLMKTPKGIIKILDFGLARIGEFREDDSQLTSTGVMMGTADYIAPEQARDARAADIRSDLYSLGCTLFYLLVGQAPFKGAETRVDKIMAHCSEPFPSVSSLRDDVPPEVVEIIGKLTAKSPGDRYQNPQEVIEALLPFAKKQTLQTDTGQTMVSTPYDTHGDQPTAVATPIPASGQRPLESPTDIEPQTLAPSAKPFAVEPLTSPQPILSGDPERSGKNHSLRIWLFFSGIGALLLVLFLYLSGAFGGAQPDQPNQSNAGPGGGSSENPPTVAAVFVYDQFCYGDFGPLRDRLAADGINVLTASTTKRTASFIDFAEDTTPNKRNVDVQLDLSELENLATEKRVDAVIFIGGFQLLDGVNDLTRPEGQTIARIVSSIRNNQGWICAIGKGVNVPYSLGLLDEGEIVDVGPWMESAPRNSVTTRTDRVYSDPTNRVISAKEWRDSEALADEIIKVVK